MATINDTGTRTIEIVYRTRAEHLDGGLNDPSLDTAFADERDAGARLALALELPRGPEAEAELRAIADEIAAKRLNLVAVKHYARRAALGCT